MFAAGSARWTALTPWGRYELWLPDAPYSAEA